jgi:hypothetical protein
VVPGPDPSRSSVYTIAGSGLTGESLGSGDLADLPAPAGVAILPGGEIIVSDSAHHALRMVTR